MSITDSTRQGSVQRTDFVYWLDVVTSGRDEEARRTGVAPLNEIGATGIIAVVGAAYS